MKGSAMFTMVPSSTTISCATEMSTRAHPRREWPLGFPVGGVRGRGDVGHEFLAFFRELQELVGGRGDVPTAGRITWSMTRSTVSSSGTRPITKERWSRMPARAGAMTSMSTSAGISPRSMARW